MNQDEFNKIGERVQMLCMETIEKFLASSDINVRDKIAIATDVLLCLTKPGPPNFEPLKQMVETIQAAGLDKYPGVSQAMEGMAFAAKKKVGN